MDEIVDIVDENDKVIGQEYKEICHKKGILHRGATVILFKDVSCRDILIQRRSKTKKHNPGKWNQIGGHLDSGESYLEGAKREMQEEMFDKHKLPKIRLEKLFKIRKNADKDFEFVTVYKAIYNGKFYMDPIEVDSYKFMEMKQLLKDMNDNPKKYTQSLIFILKEYKKYYQA